MRADTNNFAQNMQRSEETAKAVFNQIQRAAQALKDQTNFENITHSAKELSEQFYGAAKAVEKLGAGASITEAEFDEMTHSAEQGLKKLNNSLKAAQADLTRLQSTNGSLPDIEKAKQRVESLKDSIKQVNSAFDYYKSTASQAVEKVADTAKQAGRTIYDALNIKPAKQINNAIDDLNRKLIQFRSNSTLPASEVARVTRATEAEIARLRTELSGVQVSSDKGMSGLSRMGGGMNMLRTTATQLGVALAALGIGLGLKQLADIADSYTALSTRIKITVGDTGDFVKAMAGVQQVAIATNSNMEGTAQLFVKINDAGKEMGLSQQQALDLTKTINQAIQTGGGAAASTDAALRQFIQSLQSGVFRGEEFNSVAEQAPGLLKAIAQGLGVTTGELRKMASEGQLTASTTLKAIQKQGAAVQEEFNKFPITIGNALQRVATQWQVLIGQIDQASGTSKNVAAWIASLADNLGSLKTILNDVGNGFVWVGDKLAQIDPATIEEAKTVVQSLYDTLKTTMSSLGEIFESVNEANQNLLEGIFSWNSGVDTAKDKTNGLTKELQSFNVVLGLISDGVQGISIAINLLIGGVYNVVGAFDYWLSKITIGRWSKSFLKSFDEMEAKAQYFYAKADKQAMDFKSKSVQAIDEIAKTQQQKDAESAQSSKEKFDAINKQSDENFAKLQINSTRQQALQEKADKAKKDGFIGTADAHLQQIKKLEQEEQELRNKQKSITADGLDEAKAYAEARIKANNGVMDGTMQADLISKGYIVTLNEQGKVSVEAWNKNAESSANAKKAIEASKQAEADYTAFMQSSAQQRTALAKQVEEAKKSGDLSAMYSAQESLKNIDAQEKQLNEARKQRAIEAAQAQSGAGLSAVEAATKAAKELGVDTDVALNKISVGFNRSLESMQTVIDGYGALKSSGVDAAGLLSASLDQLLEKAKSQAEIDKIREMYIQFGKDGKLSNDQVASGIDNINKKLNKTPEALNETQKAFKELGLVMKKEADEAAQNKISAFELVEKSGLASQEELKKGLTDMADKIYASGNKAKIAWYENELAVHGLKSSVDDMGKASVVSLDKIQKKAQESMDQYNALVNRGTASTKELQNKLIEIAPEIEKSGTAAQKAWLKSELAVKGLTTSVGESGSTVVKKFNEAIYTMGGVEDATDKASSKFKSLGDESEDAADRSAKAWEDAGSRIAKSQSSSKSSSESPPQVSPSGHVSDPNESGWQKGSFNMWTNEATILKELKAMGINEEKAKQQAKKIYQGSSRGSFMGARAASLGYQISKYGLSSPATMDGGFSNQEFVEEQLEIVKNQVSAAKHNDAVQAKTNEALKAMKEQKQTHNYKFELGNKSFDAQIPASQAMDVDAFFKQLKLAKRSSM